ncbi:coiled-coil domain-containing protein 90B, mitochondrial isoform X2 [Erpetoichthys calabaricus]|uniref:coiled-coil domain-containing protein 90B, mitochondrial isoform X2 n=1 Tax=Erpetoichthys calabaricus TaxID=27687 RepID=UPI0010A08EE6|nr:coiled-coil domain-containing protein 90B, mitochondrial isoform X2 [Erpetoichthys calabaricus]
MFLLCRRKAGEMLYKQSRGMMKAAFKDFDYVVYHPFHSRSILKYQTRLIKKEFCTAVVETYDARKVNLTPLEQRKLSFDTHALVKDLLASGFKKEEAEILVTTLVTLTTACMDTVYRDMVTGSHQKMKNELEQVKRQLLEESKKIKADAKLDINLERSRVTDMFTEQEKKLMEVSTEFHKKNAEVDRTTMEAHKKIDIEVASLKVLLESLKLHTARYLAATVFTCLAIALGVYRFWK